MLIDCVLQSVLKAAEQAGLARAVLIHSFYAVGAWTSGSDGPIARLRREAPARPWGGADLALVATLRRLDPDGAKTLPTTVHYTGPVWQGTPRPADPPSGEPVVLVSLSTCWFPGMSQVLQRILDALSGLAVHAIVTTGEVVSPSDIRTPPNAEVHRYLPHADILSKASLLIGHGGHGTTMAALAHDVPLIVLPMARLMDQTMIGRAVADAGAGAVLAKKASPGAIAKAVETLLGDDRFRIAAGELGQKSGDKTAPPQQLTRSPQR